MKNRIPFFMTGVFLLVGVVWGLVANQQPAQSSSPVLKTTESPVIVNSLTTPTAVEVWSIPTQAVESMVALKRPMLKVGSVAPDFVLEDHDGKPVRLSDLQGKIVVINFWASWCPPCKDEMPDLQWLSEEYQKDLVVLGVNTAYVDGRSEALAFADELALTFPILFDESGDVSEGLYSVRGLPTSYWIDRRGTVRQIQVGAMTRDQMIDVAEYLLLP